MEFTNADAERRWSDLLTVLDGTVVGLDFDGTLAPIVDDPTSAGIHPDAHEALATLAPHVAGVAIITGRPAEQVIGLGDLDALADRLAAAGTELFLFGQYGNERWRGGHREIDTPEPPEGLREFVDALPDLLEEKDADGAFVEEKGLAVAVHTRRLAEPEAAFERLLDPLTALAEEHDLGVEPGRNVVEVRAPGVHKGMAVAEIAQRLGARGFLFAGDDLGDVEAMKQLDVLAEDGLRVLKVASASPEQQALVALADVVVKGPDGVVDLLTRLAHDAAER
ncbi:trehalose-phosphatase [Nocardioides bruguierae]|uniref:Trehalose 6-phosphate phosphatase n=1 Tax=Nocardioides bruguierae TaxID=2945102 RepID=A0A9X2IEA1_9ACTN|nr:trehalose-phosphatase [Nocardioides bruguierae]MCM0619838.1 trehalose-phosphatase [Nocardioides bruguierae]